MVVPAASVSFGLVDAEALGSFRRTWKSQRIGWNYVEVEREAAMASKDS
jgi:hypothetical protein